MKHKLWRQSSFDIDDSPTFRNSMIVDDVTVVNLRVVSEKPAKVFVENRAFVVVADIQEELGLKVVASIAGPDHRAIYKNCDVTVEKQVEETVAFAIEKYGTLDIMYGNAGIMGPRGSILDMDMEKGFDQTLAVNLRGKRTRVVQRACCSSHG
ncbi:hypothetical protein RHMOL_Rhmol06G0243900 [Rhododendron molle]|uniref:Uncharacterized protein n=1 Tax=Rhododendron molle TaxID=49168 RepID=A0ACC0NFX3_RHOML|nr:hypothetical protein RHMOL_Rhmol06G0243900 [Rhododendron molle]